MNFAPAPKRSQVRATTGQLLTTCAFGPGLKRLLSALSLTIGDSLSVASCVVVVVVVVVAMPPSLAPTRAVCLSHSRSLAVVAVRFEPTTCDQVDVR